MLYILSEVNQRRRDRASVAVGRFAHVTLCHMTTSRQSYCANVNKMAAFLQWRKFVFFDKDTVKDSLDNGKNFALPSGISACDSGRGHIVLGDILQQLCLASSANVGASQLADSWCWPRLGRCDSTARTEQRWRLSNLNSKSQQRAEDWTIEPSRVSFSGVGNGVTPNSV